MGCSASSRQSVIPRVIPGPPAYMVPVIVKTPTLGEDPYQIAARERAGRLQANRVIVRGAEEWSALARDVAALAK